MTPNRAFQRTVTSGPRPLVHASEGNRQVPTMLSRRSRRLLTALLVLALLAGCNSHAYYDQAIAQADAVKDELARSSICATPGACSFAEVKFEAGGWKIGPFRGGGVTINVYGVSDIALARRILARCKSLHAKNATAAVTVTIYSSTHAQRIESGRMNVVLKEKIT